MRILALAVSALLLTGCESLIYKLATRQGNVIEQKQLDKLEVGMTPDQVRFLLGTPVASSPFRTDRWDYLGYYRSPRGEVSSRTVSLYFQDQKLARMEGIQSAKADARLETPDVEAVLETEKKQKLEEQRAADPDPKGGIVIQPEAAPGKPE